MKKIGYIRVSTKDQKEDRQVDGLKALCDEIYIEKRSATDKNRPVFEQILRKLKTGDTLVIWSVDRAFRSTCKAIQEAEKLRERGVHFQIVQLNIDTTTAAGRYVYAVTAAGAEFERDFLIERTKEGIECARRKGKRIGRPPLFSEKLLRRAHTKITKDKITLNALAAEMGCCRDTLPKAFKRMGLAI